MLVHGAFADSSSWNGVVTRLARDGYPVVAVANPLRSVSGDAAYLAIYEGDRIEDAETWLHQSPLYQARLYERVDVYEYRVEVGNLS